MISEADLMRKRKKMKKRVKKMSTKKSVEMKETTKARTIAELTQELSSHTIFLMHHHIRRGYHASAPCLWKKAAA